MTDYTREALAEIQRRRDAARAGDAAETGASFWRVSWFQGRADELARALAEIDRTLGPPEADADARVRAVAARIGRGERAVRVREGIAVEAAPECWLLGTPEAVAGLLEILLGADLPHRP